MSGQYVEAFDPRQSCRVSMQTFQSQLSHPRSRLSGDVMLSMALAKLFLALSLHIARDWILAQAMSLWSLAAATLTFGAIGLALWEQVWERPRGKGKRREDPLAKTYSLIYVCEVVFGLLALTKLSVLRFMMLTALSPLWARGPPTTLLSGGGNKSLGKGNSFLIAAIMVVLAFFADSVLTGSAPKPGYFWVFAHLLCCGQRADMLSVLPIEARGKAHAFGTAGAAALACFASFVHNFAAPETTSHSVPFATTPTFDSFVAPDPSTSLLLSSSAVIAIASVMIDPLLSRNITNTYAPARQISYGWFVTVFASLFVGFVGFGRTPSIAEGLVGAIAWTGIAHLVSSDPRSVTTYSSSRIATSAGRAPLLSSVSEFTRHFRATIETILATPDSRRIYFFLCLNLAFMFVQMAYGIWTNSLGLISDSIHMFFDCLALAMGLFASVMATWEPNAKFTYGYSRVETLSGYANGVFLCLISIFIVFEAIQRLLDPPEMNTNQLLTVSTMGLVVNLVGMFATGHHHHGHSHGGGHSHAPAPAPKSHSHSTPSQAGHSVSRGRGEAMLEADFDGQHHDEASNGHSHTNGAAHSHDKREHGGHVSHSHASHGHSHAGCDDDLEEEDDDHGHAGHGHSHNMKGVFLHVLADTLGSVGVIISTLLIQKFGWTGFDPLASILIAVLIFASVVPLVVDSGRLLMLDMGEEREAEVRKALSDLQGVEGVSSYSQAKFWAKDPTSMVGSISIQLAPSHASHDFGRPGSSVDTGNYADVEKTKARVRRTLKRAIAGLDELVIQVEPTGGL